MSERLHQAPEHHAPEHKPEHGSEHLEKELKEKSGAAKHEHQEALDQIKFKIEQEAVSGREFPAVNTEQDTSSKPTILTKDIRNHSLKETLSHVRRHLKPTERRFSKFIHSPTVERVSDIAGKTIARPSGLLSGGIAAFAGSLALIYITRHFGYEYRYSAYLWLFGAGFIAGLALEYLIGLFRRKRNS